MMRAMTWAAAAATLALAGCYEPPGELAAEDVLQIRLDTTGPVPADGSSYLDFSLVLAGGSTAGAKITVGTSHGVLDPTGATDSARRQLAVYTDGGDVLSLKLRAGRDAGAGVLTAMIKDSLQVQRTFALTRALPDQLALTPSPGSTFTATTTRLDVVAALAREDGKGQVSSGTRVSFLTCCTLSSTLGACDARLLVPAFVEASGTAPGSVKASVSLTAEGLAFVKQKGTPPTDDYHATLFALVLRPGKVAPGCDALSKVTKPAAHQDVAAGASVRLTLQHAATTTTK